MTIDDDPTNDQVFGAPVPFAVSHPCPACHGEGTIDSATCPVCHGTGVARYYHGTKADLKPGDLISAGYSANFGPTERTANYVYCAGTMDAAIWGAELAAGEGRGRLYIVEPTGELEDDPNLTDKRFPGNPTKSYRSKEPLRVVAEIKEWQGHAPELLQTMRDGLKQLSEQGVEPID